jgi:hypothetical protein
MDHPTITLSLTSDEALVLFDFLSRCCDEGLLAIHDPAELRVLGTLYTRVVQLLRAPNDPNYQALLQAARARVLTQ